MIYIIDHKDSFTNNVIHQFENFDEVECDNFNEIKKKKLDKAKVLDSYNKKYHIYDHEFGQHISDEKQRRTRGIFYTILIGLVFVFSHYMAVRSVDQPASFYPPYIEKKIIYPELYKK